MRCATRHAVERTSQIDHNPFIPKIKAQLHSALEQSNVSSKRAWQFGACTVNDIPKLRDILEAFASANYHGAGDLE